MFSRSGWGSWPGTESGREGEDVGKTGRPNTGLRYKRFSIGFTKELDEKVKRMNDLPGFRKCTYVDCVRILIDAGLDAMSERYPEIDGKL